MKKHLDFYKGGLAYLLMIGLTYTVGAILMVLATFIIAKIAGIPYDYEQILLRDDFTFVALVINQIMFIIACLPFMRKVKDVKRICNFNKPTKKLDYLAAILLGIGMILGMTVLSEVFIKLLGLVGYTPTPSPFPVMKGKTGTFITAIFAVCLLPAICEEMFFRGLLLDSLRGVSDWFAAIISAVMFMLIHASPLQTLYQFIGGLIFAIVAIKSNSILPGIVMHFLNNFYAILLDYVGLGELSFPTFAVVIGWVLIVLCLTYFLTKKELVMTFKRQKEEVVRLADDDRINELLLREKKAQNTSNNIVGILAYVASVILCLVLWITQFVAGLG